MKRPRKGQRGDVRKWDKNGRPGEIVGQFTVLRTDENICHAQYDNQAEPSSFIWRFGSMPNQLHDWPDKGPNACLSFRAKDERGARKEWDLMPEFMRDNYRRVAKNLLADPVHGQNKRVQMLSKVMGLQK